MKTYLFIGGSLDGVWWEVENPLPTIQVAIPNYTTPTKRVSERDMTSPMMTMMKVKAPRLEVYSLSQFCGDEKDGRDVRFEIYCSPGLSGADVMRRLFAHYRPSENSG